MQSGKLHQLIQIERQTETISPSGAVQHNWQVIATARAEPVTLSASEFLSGMGDAETRNAVWRIRWIPELTTKDRIRHGSETYDLKEIIEIGRRKALELRAVRVSA